MKMELISGKFGLWVRGQRVEVGDGWIGIAKERGGIT